MRSHVVFGAMLAACLVVILSCDDNVDSTDKENSPGMCEDGSDNDDDGFIDCDDSDCQNFTHCQNQVVDMTSSLDSGPDDPADDGGKDVVEIVEMGMDVVVPDSNQAPGTLEIHVQTFAGMQCGSDDQDDCKGTLTVELFPCGDLVCERLTSRQFMNADLSENQLVSYTIEDVPAQIYVFAYLKDKEESWDQPQTGDLAKFSGMVNLSQDGTTELDIFLERVDTTVTGTISTDPSVNCGALLSDDCQGALYVVGYLCADFACKRVGMDVYEDVDLSDAKTFSYDLGTAPPDGMFYVAAFLKEEGSDWPLSEVGDLWTSMPEPITVQPGGISTLDLSLTRAAPNISGEVALGNSVVCGATQDDDCIGRLTLIATHCASIGDPTFCPIYGVLHFDDVDLSGGMSVAYAFATLPSEGTYNLSALFEDAGEADTSLAPGDMITETPVQVTVLSGGTATENLSLQRAIPSLQGNIFVDNAITCGETEADDCKGTLVIGVTGCLEAGCGESYATRVVSDVDLSQGNPFPYAFMDLPDGENVYVTALFKEDPESENFITEPGDLTSDKTSPPAILITAGNAVDHDVALVTRHVDPTPEPDAGADIAGEPDAGADIAGDQSSSDDADPDSDHLPGNLEIQIQVLAGVPCGTDDQDDCEGMLSVLLFPCADLDCEPVDSRNLLPADLSGNQTVSLIFGNVPEQIYVLAYLKDKEDWWDEPRTGDLAKTFMIVDIPQEVGTKTSEVFLERVETTVTGTISTDPSVICDALLPTHDCQGELVVVGYVCGGFDCVRVGMDIYENVDLSGAKTFSYNLGTAPPDGVFYVAAFLKEGAYGGPLNNVGNLWTSMPVAINVQPGTVSTLDFSLTRAAPNISGEITLDDSVVCGATPDDDCVGHLTVLATHCTSFADASDCPIYGSSIIEEADLRGGVSLPYEFATIPSEGTYNILAVFKESGEEDMNPAPGDLILEPYMQVTVPNGGSVTQNFLLQRTKPLLQGNVYVDNAITCGTTEADDCKGALVVWVTGCLWSQCGEQHSISVHKDVDLSQGQSITYGFNDLPDGENVYVTATFKEVFPGTNLLDPGDLASNITSTPSILITEGTTVDHDVVLVKRY